MKKTKKPSFSKIRKLNLYKRKIKRYLPLLSHLAADKKNEKLIANTKKPVIKLIEDICQNCTNGILIKQFKRNADLKKRSKSVQFISSQPGKKIKEKKKLLQTGNGLLSALLGVGIPALLELLKAT